MTASTPWGGKVFYKPSTTSTMDDARELEDRGEPDGSVAWTAFQTAGQGRHPGRVWQAAPGSSLLCTVYWHPRRFRHPEFAPSLTVGLGLCLWLEGLLPEPSSIRLKWPNDVYWNDRKLAGILVRQRWSAAGPGAIHAGIGTNLLPPKETDGLRTSPCSMVEAGVRVAPEAALETLLVALARALDVDDPRTACEQRLWRRGQEMELSVPGTDGGPRTGMVRGLDPEGRLVWDGPSGRESISSGE